MIDMLTTLFGALSPLWEMSLTAAYAAAIVALLRLVLKKRAPKQVLCLLWLVVFARLLVPVSLESPLSIVPNARQVQQLTGEAPAPPGKDGEHTVSIQPTGQSPTQAYDPNQNPSVVWPYGSNENPFVQDGAGTDPALPVPASLELPAPFPWRAILAGVWLAGALAMGGYGLMSCLRLKRRLYDAIRAQDGAWEHPDLTSPFILGVFRPKIYLPAGLYGRSRQFILCHERAHLRRCDHIVKPVCWLALALHWFNPLVWMAFLLMGRDIEAACDEAVIRQLGPQVKADYSATLLSLATSGRVPAPCPLAFDEGNAKGRIKNVLRYRRPAVWIVAASAIVAALAAVCLLTDPVSAGTPEGEPDPGPDVSASQAPAPSLPPVEGGPIADPWMLEVLDGERTFHSGTEEFSIHQLRTMVYGDDEPPRLTLEVGKLAVMDLDRDGVNEMVVWPVDTLGERDDPTEIGYYTGYFIFRRQGDAVQVYHPGWRSIGNLKADGTFDWSNSAFNWGAGRARFDGGFEVEEITWCVNGLDKGLDGGFYVDGLEAAREEFKAAVAAQSAKPEPAWYVREGGRLWPAPLDAPFRPDSLTADPGPRALTQEELAYFQAYFAMGDGRVPNIRSMLLVSEYSDPRDIDLFRTFYHGFHYVPDISQAERDALGWNGYFEEIKVTAKEMDETLLAYLGLTLEETNKVGLELFNYLPEYGAYYTAHTDFGGDMFTIYSGRILEDGSIELTYDGINWQTGIRVAVLEEAERPYAPRLYYQVKSNLRADWEELSPAPSGPAPADMSATAGWT